jgi:micrococcal nuclease
VGSLRAAGGIGKPCDRRGGAKRRITSPGPTHLLAALLCWAVTGLSGRVIDGDTFWAKLDIWLNLHAIQTIRLLGVDTPELRDEGGEAARRFTHEWLTKGAITVSACKADNFGRVLGKVTRDDQDLAELLIRAGHGVRR